MDAIHLCRKPSCAGHCLDCAAAKRAASQERSAPPQQRRSRPEDAA